MGENKRYYWLKLDENFFDDDTISFIEEQENGKDYVIFYLKLCLKSVKTNGSLYRVVGETFIPYDPKTLAKITNTNIDIVKVAMELFTKLGMVQIKETGEIYLAQINEMIGTETDKAKYMREKRAVEKLEGNNVTQMLPDCSQNVPKCYTEKEKEKEKDIERKKNKKAPLFDEIDIFTNNLELRDIIKKWLSMMLKSTKNYELEQFKIQLENLSKVQSDGRRIEIVKNHYSNNHRALVYENEIYKNNKTYTSRYDNAGMHVDKNHDYSQDGGKVDENGMIGF